MFAKQQFIAYKTDHQYLDFYYFPYRRCRASSILQKNTKLYGPLNALDSKESTCWNSEGIEGSTQWFLLDFGRPVEPTEIRLQFQAGFAAEICHIDVKDVEWEALDEVEWEDVHEIQTVTLEKTKTCTAIKLTFSEMTDFYDRVTIYRLEVWGKEVNQL